MAKLHDAWTVLPHDPPLLLEPGLLTVVGQIPLPLGNFPRRMTAVALGGGRSALFSPIPLDEAGMARLEALGAPAFLVVPNAGHRLDLRPFHARFPDATIVTARGAREAVEEAARPVATEADLGARAELVPVAGVDDGELAMLVHGADEITLVTNDIIGHVRSPRGPGAWLMSRLMGFGPRAQVPRLVRRMYIKQPDLLAAQMRAWAALPNLRRLIPSHGDIIDAPTATLLRLADTLDR